MKKKAIVLLVTIGFIAIITAIIMQTVSISKSSLDGLMSLKRQNQMMVLINDAKKILENKELVDYLTKNETKIPIQDQKSGLSITFSCIALKNRFNLTKFVDSNNTCKQVVKDFASSHDLGSEDTFFNLVKSMKNIQDLKKIKEDYLAETRDFFIENITDEKFEKVFFVSDLNTTISNNIDTNASEEICKLLNVSDEDCKKKFENILKNCLPRARTSDANSTNQTNIKNLIKCKINLYNGSQENGAVFKYDTNKKEIVSIDEFF